MSNTEVVFTISLAAFGGLLGLLSWFVKDKMKRYDKHLEDCSARAKNDGAIEQRLENLETNSHDQTQTLTWVGDCLITMGAKLNVPELPKRPSR